ncbi:MAG: hypothetical protein GF307_14125, partial [candidate division Zixibacteria bacterium]|nr:hypothetical protein [candidate division Zixibacteria bacterium]
MRTNRAIIASLCLLVVFGFGEVFAQGVDFNFIGAGARARGMGGAFIGVADDATAISWNPAGLATLERAEASAVGYYAIQKYEFKDEFTREEISGSASGSGTYEESSSQSHPSFNFGSLAFPLTAGSNNIVVAAAYQRLIDLYDLYQDSTLTQEYKGGVDV